MGYKDETVRFDFDDSRKKKLAKLLRSYTVRLKKKGTIQLTKS